MKRLIKRLRDNRSVVFDEGRFDNWCVFVVEKNGTKKAPDDEQYFSELQEIAKSYRTGKVYDDFVKIYNLTDGTIRKTVIDLIDEIVKTYHPEHQILMEKWLTVIYAGMVAEENKERAVLKKRIKRLGMHQVLITGLSAKKAAKFSYLKKWKELDVIMKKYGF